MLCSRAHGTEPTLRRSGPDYRRAAELLAGMCAVLALTACGGLSRDTAATVDPADCAKIAAQRAPDGAPVIVMIVDNTASGTAQRLAPSAREALVAAQREDASLTLLAVDGAGRAPRAVLANVALDPSPDRESATADAARSIAIDCVEHWAGQREAVPTAPGSDVLSAVNAAARQHPRWLVVASDGVASAGPLNIVRLGFDADPLQVVAAMRTADVLPDLTGVTAVWSQLGETVAPAPQPVRHDLEALWRAVFSAAGSELVVDSRLTPAGPRNVTGLPDDTTNYPDVQIELNPDGSRSITIPDPLLFTPGSAELAPGADAVLGSLARELMDTQGTVAVVHGHCADYGTPEYQQSISTRRAEAVRARLIMLGAPGAAVTAQGHGSRQPAQPEWRDGVHDESAAAANRRVVIEIR